MFRRILVPLQLLPDSMRAAGGAAHLARTHRGQVRACYVLDRAVVFGDGTFLADRDRLRRNLERKARRALARLKALCRQLKVPCSEVVSEGGVADAFWPRLAGSART